MNHPVVTIVIPHFERSDLIRETIQSIVSQEEKNWEIIVVDDGSSLPEWEALKKIEAENIRVLRREDGPKGPSRCRNLGWQAARADLILFLDSDDLLAPWCLRQRLATALSHPGADCWIFPVMLFQEKPGDLGEFWGCMIAPEDDALRFARGEGPWHTSSPLWRRTGLEKTGGFNEAVMYGDDAELHIRAVVQALTIAKFPYALPDAFVRRSGEGRITNTPLPKIEESRRTRLAETTRFLKTHPRASHILKTWEGQYIVEAEFLLFRGAPATSIRRVLRSWSEEWTPSLWRQLVTRGYIGLAILTRRPAYLLLRVARRIAMKLLPSEYFPAGAGASVTVPPSVLDELRQRL